jgi:hypothetical protein
MDTLAVFNGWNEDEIAAYWVELISIPDGQQVVLRRAKAPDYYYLGITGPQIPVLACIAILGRERFVMDIEGGSMEDMGGALSRALGWKFSPMEQSEIERNDRQITLRHLLEPVPLLQQVVKEHWLVFTSGGLRSGRQPHYCGSCHTTVVKS